MWHWPCNWQTLPASSHHVSLQYMTLTSCLMNKDHVMPTNLMDKNHVIMWNWLTFDEKGKCHADKSDGQELRDHVKLTHIWWIRTMSCRQIRWARTMWSCETDSHLMNKDPVMPTNLMDKDHVIMWNWHTFDEQGPCYTDLVFDGPGPVVHVIAISQNIHHPMIPQQLNLVFFLGLSDTSQCRTEVKMCDLVLLLGRSNTTHCHAKVKMCGIIHIT